MEGVSKPGAPGHQRLCVVIPYWTSDIGGYHFHWQAPDWSTPDNRELFTRWFQFGTWPRIFRIHGKGERALFSDNWDAGTKEILFTYDNLRYRLMPYIYPLSWKVTNEGYTIMRSLAFDFRDDPGIQNIPDQYMFGPAFMVCPVTERMDELPAIKKTGKSRSVYLPAGTDWFDFWTGKKTEGGQTIAAKASIETIPLYIKSRIDHTDGTLPAVFRRESCRSYNVENIPPVQMPILCCMRMRTIHTTTKKVCTLPSLFTGTKKHRH